MNVPSPAPCHVNVAGVGKQSVWGLRIIARTQLSLWHDFVNSSMAKSGCQSVRLAGFSDGHVKVHSPTDTPSLMSAPAENDA